MSSKPEIYSVKQRKQQPQHPCMFQFINNVKMKVSEKYRRHKSMV